MRRLATALPAHARIQAAADFLAHFTDREVLFIAPTRTAADEVVRTLSLKTGGSFGVHRFTVAALAVECTAEFLAENGVSILSGVAVEALAARSVEMCRTNASLKWFEPVATTPGFFRALASTITELRMNEVDAEKLAACGPPGADLALLAAAFESALKDARIADLAAIYQARCNKPSRYAAMPILLMDVVPKSLLERRFIESIIAGATDVLATAHSRNEVAVTTFETILGTGAEPITDLSSANALSRLRTHVFSIPTPPTGTVDSSIDFRSASDESREAVEIARMITAAAQAGMGFDRMAILLRNPEAYQPLIEDALRRADIPSFYTLGSRRPNPAGRAFLSLLACASEGLSASRFGEYLSLGQVPDPEAPNEPRWVPVQGELFASEAEGESKPPAATMDLVRAPQAWERLLVDASVIGGRDRWERRLNGLDHEIQKQIEEVQAEDEGRLLRLQRRRERLKDLRRFAIPLIERLDQLPAEGTWGDWLAVLEALASHALKQPEVVLSALAELRPMAKIGPVTLDEIIEVLTNRLTFLRMDSTERRYGKVYVATIDEAAGMAFENVFVPGLGEDIFPKRAFEDPLLLDEQRRAVSRDLATQETRVAEERWRFHLATSSSGHTLFISYPRMNLAQARARGPSFYALEVLRAVTGRVPDLQELQRTAAESSQSQAGWPSPRNPAVAIDDAEYDLAMVSRLLRSPVEEARGRGRYLVTVNAVLGRSLRNRAGRWRRRWTEGDGIVDPDLATIAVLAEHRPAARPYSATALQQFAACPYRFALQAIHRLQPREEVAVLERMDALTRGSLFHSIQFHLLSTLRDRDLLPITAANRGRALEVADEVIHAVSETYREELAPAIPRIWEGEVEDIRWDIRGWLREMTQVEGEASWKPQWFELAFGLPADRDRDPASRPDAVDLPGGLHLRGSIDMIEERVGHIRITDHKTGRVPMTPPGLTGRGEVLQPILYAQAAEAILGKVADSARLFYCTERGGYRSIDVPINEEARDALDQVVRTIDTSIATGFLPAAPRDGACAWCDYRVVCGPYEEIRVRRKPKDRLAPLDQLRKSL